MRNRKIWLITDTHFNDRAMEDLRPPDYQRRIISNCRQLVAAQDTLIHLGDVIMSRPGELLHILNEIKGTKILVRGNHDSAPDNWYITHGFHFCCFGLAINDVYLSHVPQEKLPTGTRLNVHGHFHNFGKRESVFEAFYDEKIHRLFALEYTDYMPVCLEEFCK